MALLDIVTKGSTNRSLPLIMCDSTTGERETGVVAATSGLDIWYRREGGLKVSLTPSNLATLDAAHADGGILHASHGEYRVDFPDAAYATGANYVDVGWGATGMIGFGGRVRLTNLDLEDGDGSSLTEAGGTGDQFTDLPKGLTPILTGTAQSATSTTIVLAASTSLANDIPNRTVINIISGTGAGQSRIIRDYDGATDTATIYPPWTANPGSDSVYEVVQGSVNLEMWMGDTVNTVANLGDGHNYPTVYIAGFSAASGQTAVTNMLNNYSGTITSFDALDTAQDTQHGTTQTAIADVPTVAEFNARTLVAAAYFDPAVDVVARVTLVDTTTANSDMRGTNNAATPAQVNAEVVDALNVDTYPEPGQGAPPATASIVAKIGYLFKAFKNKKTQTSSGLNLFNDAGTTIDQKSAHSDDGTTLTTDEFITGP